MGDVSMQRWFRRTIARRSFRRIFLTITLLFLFLTVTAHVRCFFLARRAEAVLRGLEQMRLDQTTEDQLLATVPYLTRYGQNRVVGSRMERRYGALISNESDWLLGGPLLSGPGDWLYEFDNRLGYRTLIFTAEVYLIDGKVSHISYAVANRGHIFPREAGNIVSAESAHGFWNESGHVVVRTVDDESPQFRVFGDEKSLRITYTSDAPPELSSLAFQIDMSCFWSIRQRCRRSSQVAPLWWHRKAAIEASALTRLTSQSPCPERIMVARVRYYPDVNVELLDVVRSQEIAGNDEGMIRADETLIDYRLEAVLRGKSSGTLTKVRYSALIPSPTESVLIVNPVPPFRRAGKQVLLFSGSIFDSCRVLSATPSAVSAVESAVPVSKYREDRTPKLFM